MKAGVSKVSVEKKELKDQGLENGKETQGRIPMKRLYTVAEASLYLGKGKYGIREMIWNGVFPVVRDGRKMLLDVHDLDQWIEQKKANYSLREQDERPGNGKKKRWDAN